MCHCALTHCKVCLGFMLGSERNDCIGVPNGHAFDCDCSLFHSSRLYLLPPSRIDHRRKITANKSLSFPLSQPLSLFLPVCFSLSLYFRQRRLALSRSCMAPVFTVVL